MASYVQVTLIGNLGRDGTLRYTSSGQAVCDFSLATTRRWTERNTNEKREETTWWKVSVWGSLAESINQYLVKGTQVLVVADRVKADMYTGQDGQTRVNLEVTARDIQLLGSRGGGGNQGMGQHEDQYAPSDVDDIPF